MQQLLCVIGMLVSKRMYNRGAAAAHVLDLPLFPLSEEEETDFCFVGRYPPMSPSSVTRLVPA